MRRDRWAGSRAVPLEEAARRLGVAWDETARRAARRFPLRFPEPYLDLARDGDAEELIRRIGWPEPEEIGPDPEAIDDPVGERHGRPHPFVIRKHQDRALLLLTSRCHFYCRFCFRAGHRADPSDEQLREAIELLAETGGIREVILTGGDPLVLGDERLGEILRELGRVPQLATVRLHTRAPVHDPPRVTPHLVRTLVESSPARLWIALHTTHPRELAAGFLRAVRLLREAGVPLLNQTVLLEGVNAEVGVLAELFGTLYQHGVRPYYLHHPDRIAGTARFRVRIEDGLDIHRQLRVRLPGPAVPQYVLDLPDGTGKVPVDWLQQDGPGRWVYRAPDGDHRYLDIDRPRRESLAPGPRLR
ncbi:MAG: KamA family radical SAM protein [Acidobacteriota bacterium]|nr:MAG: KamA family radical SAM protein [Acidobacteriota bacterium]